MPACPGSGTYKPAGNVASAGDSADTGRRPLLNARSRSLKRGDEQSMCSDETPRSLLELHQNAEFQIDIASETISPEALHSAISTRESFVPLWAELVETKMGHWFRDSRSV